MTGVPLEKLQQAAPHLVELRRQAETALAGTQLGPNHRAKVVLALAATTSMRFFYDTGLVRAAAERLLALASVVDDDGDIDLFFFGAEEWHPGKLTLKNHRGAINKLWPGKELAENEMGRGIHQIRKKFNGHKTFGSNQKPDLPAFVLLITDGDPFDFNYAARQIFESSREPIWWECVGTPRGERFGFLEVLHNPDEVDPDFAAEYATEIELLRTRDLDNVHSFVSDLDDPGLYQRMLEKYPEWVEGTRGRLWGYAGAVFRG